VEGSTKVGRKKWGKDDSLISIEKGGTSELIARRPRIRAVGSSFETEGISWEGNRRFTETSENPESLKGSKRPLISPSLFKLRAITRKSKEVQTTVICQEGRVGNWIGGKKTQKKY